MRVELLLKISAHFLVDTIGSEDGGASLVAWLMIWNNRSAPVLSMGR